MSVLWDQRAAARADLIESINRSFEAAFGTGPLINALLEKDVSSQYYCAN